MKKRPGNKKGLDAVVTTLIIILLALVAIGIIWVVIVNVINNSANQISLEKFSLGLNIKNAGVSGSDLVVNVKRTVGQGNLTGVRFVFYDGANSITIDREVPLAQLEERNFIFTTAELGNVSLIQSVSVAPLFKSSNGESIPGDISETRQISGAYIPPAQNVSCTLTGATWSTTNVTEGSSVNLNVQGTGCGGQIMSFVVMESDSLSPDDPVTTNPVSVVMGSSSGTGTWIAEWQSDTDFGASNPPEYYFIATIAVANQSLKSTNEMTVYQQPAGASELIAYYKFDETSGATAIDSSGNNNNGVLTNGPTRTTGVSGTALSFDGVNDYVSLPDNLLDNLSVGSFCSWIYWDVPSDNNNSFQLLTDTEISANNYVGEITISDNDFADRKSAFFNTHIRQGSGNDFNVTSNNNVALRQTWQYFCAVQDGTFVNFYLNGQHMASTGGRTGISTDSDWFGDIAANAQIVSLGSYRGISGFFKGKMDEVRIYNRALSSLEIQDLYNSITPPVLLSARGRVKVVNNTVVADNGALLRGTHLRFGDEGYRNFTWVTDDIGIYRNLSWWTDIRDNYNLNTVRIMAYILPEHSVNMSDLRELNDYSQKVDLAVNLATQAGMYVILDDHSSCCQQYNKNETRLFWQYFAPRYANYTNVIYELKNEPVYHAEGYTAEEIDFQEEMYNYIRSVAPDTHIILWSFDGGSQDKALGIVNNGTEINYTDASVAVHPYKYATIDPNFTYLSQLKENYPVIISEFANCCHLESASDRLAIWNWAEQTGTSWIYLDINLSVDHSGATNPDEWPMIWPQDPYYL